MRGSGGRCLIVRTRSKGFCCMHRRYGCATTAGSPSGTVRCPSCRFSHHHEHHFFKFHFTLSSHWVPAHAVNVVVEVVSQDIPLWVLLLVCSLLFPSDAAQAQTRGVASSLSFAVQLSFFGQVFVFLFILNYSFFGCNVSCRGMNALCCTTSEQARKLNCTSAGQTSLKFIRCQGHRPLHIPRRVNRAPYGASHRLLRDNTHGHREYNGGS